MGCRIFCNISCKRIAYLQYCGYATLRTHGQKLLRDQAPDAKVDFFLGDLSSIQDVQHIGSEIKTAYPRIDILINNAGLHGFEQRITTDGFAKKVAVNYLAPWLLTYILLPTLKAVPDARIVNVASEVSRNYGRLELPGDFTNISVFNHKDSLQLYGKTKLLDIMFTGELSRRLAGTGGASNALNPGSNVTGLGRELGFAGALTRVLNLLHIGDPQKGAEIILRLAVDHKYQGTTGGYFNVGTGKPITPIYPGGDNEMQKQLCENTEALMRQKGFID